MNKLIICLLSAYIGFMACNVKKQLHRRTVLTDSLRQIAHSSGDKRIASRDITGIAVDSLHAHIDWKELWIDSLLREPALPADRNASVGIYGIHWVAGRQKTGGISRLAFEDKAAEKISRTSADSIMLHNRSQGSTLGKQIRKSPVAGWWLFAAVALVTMGVIGFFYKKIRKAFKF